LLHEKLREYRDVLLQVEEMNSILSDLKKQENDLKFNRLPDLFDELEIDNIGVRSTPDESNMPAYDASISNYYHANIAANWDEKKKADAFAELSRAGAADIINTAVTVTFPQTQGQLAQDLYTELTRRGLAVTISPSIPWNRLTSWLRSHCESGRPWPDLEKIGAKVGRKVELKMRDET